MPRDFGTRALAAQLSVRSVGRTGGKASRQLPQKLTCGNMGDTAVRITSIFQRVRVRARHPVFLRRIVLSAGVSIVLAIFATWLVPIFDPPDPGAVFARRPDARETIRDALDARLQYVAIEINPLVLGYVHVISPRGFIRTSVRWDNLILGLGGIIIAALTLRQMLMVFPFAYIFGESTAGDRTRWRTRRVSPSVVFDEESYAPTAQIPGAQQPTQATAHAILEEDVKRALALAKSLYGRSTLLLSGGIVMAFIGIGVFWVSLPEIGTTATADSVLNYLPRAIRPVGMLLFVEAIAWFLLRQYRALIEDYKTFHRLYLRRSNYLVALSIGSDPTVTPALLLVAAALLTEDVAGKLRPGETTEQIESMKQIDPNPLTDLMGKVIDRAAELASKAAATEAK